MVPPSNNPSLRMPEAFFNGAIEASTELLLLDQNLCFLDSNRTLANMHGDLR